MEQCSLIDGYKRDAGTELVLNKTEYKPRNSMKSTSETMMRLQLKRTSPSKGDLVNCNC